jgi:hypothetical protein
VSEVVLSVGGGGSGGVFDMLGYVSGDSGMREKFSKGESVSSIVRRSKKGLNLQR